MRTLKPVLEASVWIIEPRVARWMQRDLDHLVYLVWCDRFVRRVVHRVLMRWQSVSARGKAGHLQHHGFLQ